MPNSLAKRWKNSQHDAGGVPAFQNPRIVVKRGPIPYSENHMLPPEEKKFLHALATAGAEYDAMQKLRAAFASHEAAWRVQE